MNLSKCSLHCSIITLRKRRRKLTSFSDLSSISLYYFCNKKEAKWILLISILNQSPKQAGKLRPVNTPFHSMLQPFNTLNPHNFETCHFNFKNRVQPHSDGPKHPPGPARHALLGASFSEAGSKVGWGGEGYDAGACLPDRAQSPSPPLPSPSRGGEGHRHFLVLQDTEL